MIVIADAGPLLHLFWIGASSWALPPQPIDVVQEVWEEVQSHAPAALQEGQLRRIAQAVPISSDLTKWNLDQGEQAALSYALSLSQQCEEEILVLCDEREARQACTALSLPVVGSMGHIIEAARADRVSLPIAVAALRDLPGRGRLHVRPHLIELAVETVNNLH